MFYRQKTSLSKLIKVTAFGICAGLPSGMAYAQEQTFIPLEEALINGGESSYFAIRCASLYASMARWAGETQLGSETYSGLLANADNLVNIAAQLRSDTNGNAVDLAKKRAYEDLVLIANIYIGRYQDSYSRTGQAWESDDLWKSDLSFCSEMGRQK